MLGQYRTLTVVACARSVPHIDSSSRKLIARYRAEYISCGVPSGSGVAVAQYRTCRRKRVARYRAEYQVGVG
eukprot:1886229-Rhodomonas_salina.1